MAVVGLKLSYYVGTQERGLLFREFAAAFERAGNEVGAIGKYMFPRIQTLLEAEAAEQFSARGKGSQGPWAPLSEPYRAWKAKRYPGKGILERSGDLRAALTSPTSPHAERSYTESMMNFGTLGLPYASYHQTGTARMVARPPIDMTADFQGKLEKEALAAVREAIHRSGADEYLARGAGGGEDG